MQPNNNVAMPAFSTDSKHFKSILLKIREKHLYKVVVVFNKIFNSTAYGILAQRAHEYKLGIELIKLKFKTGSHIHTAFLIYQPNLPVM